MKLAVVGTGYVGLVAGVCFAESGNDVLCVDNVEEKVARLRAGEMTIYEPGLERLFERNRREERLRFTTDLCEAVDFADIIFMALPTPAGQDGSADLRYMLGAAHDIGRCLKEYKLIVNKSTVPVGTVDLVRAEIAKNAPCEFDVASNPEFLREGVAVEDFMKPERVVVGVESERAEKLLRELYHPFLLSGNPFMVMDPRSAEVTKYAANSMLALRISFMNDIARLCENCDANIDFVRLGIGVDSRIGKRFLFPGIGYGGSCFEASETVFAVAQSGARAQSFAALWEEHAASQAVVRDKNLQYVVPRNLRVLAFDEESGRCETAQVEALTRRVYCGPMIRLQTAMGRALRVTADHPVIVAEGASTRIVEAARVRPGDVLLAVCELPTLPFSPSLDLIELLHDTPLENDVYVTSKSGAFTAQYARFAPHVALEDLRYPHEIKRFNRMSLRLFRKLRDLRVLAVPAEDLQLYTAKGAATKMNAVVSLDADFVRLCGYYLAEGCISVDAGRAGSQRHRVEWCFHENENEYIDDVRATLEKLGLKWRERRGPGARATTISSRVLAWLLRDVLGCGTRSENKAMPAFALGLTPALRHELLRGAWSGDGSFTALNNGRNGCLGYATVSRELANGLALCLQSLGIVASLHARRMSKSKRDAYVLRVNGRRQIETLRGVLGATGRERIETVLNRYVRDIAQRSFVQQNGFARLVVQKVERQDETCTVYSMETSLGTLLASSGLVAHNCFPKDVQALIETGRKYDAPQRLLEATHAINEAQKSSLVPRVLAHFGGDISGRRFAIWGLAFKPNTDDIREAPAFHIIEQLLQNGATVCAYDPEAMDATRRVLGERIDYAARHYDACDGADALIIATEWSNFREPDFGHLRELLQEPVIFDGRNVYDIEAMRSHNFTYYSIGRPTVFTDQEIPV